MTTRVAMWSGPRNISTAMMRSFGSRADTVVADEPFYAHYLAVTGLDHPGRDAVLASQPNRWQDVAAALTGPPLAGAAVYYQKHMAHHLLPGMGRSWLPALTHAFLIRDPAHVVASYARVRGEPTLADLGYPQQAEIFRAFGGPVVDAADVLRDPDAVLRRLCAALGLEFDPAMLRWLSRAARHRRRVGAALVRVGAGLHRVRAVRPGAGRGAAAAAPARRGGNPVLRGAGRAPALTPYPVTTGVPCARACSR
nr:hypothetical protein GCM10020092_031040 [Actinoplanes digitatis]